MIADAVVDSPFGALFLSASPRGLTRIDFAEGARALGPRVELAEPTPSSGGGELLAAACSQIEEYLAGRRRAFDLPLDVTGTPFQRRVWQAIAAVPFGTTVTYAAIAETIGAPNAYRAVGTACGANPISIVVPCHRIVGSDRGLHGFGGGLSAKAWLLAHEGALDDGMRPGPASSTAAARV